MRKRVPVLRIFMKAEKDFWRDGCAVAGGRLDITRARLCSRFVCKAKSAFCKS